jgi:hypothetical protein
MVSYVLKNNRFVPPEAPRFTGKYAKAMEEGQCAFYARLASLTIFLDTHIDPGYRIWTPSTNKRGGAWEYAYNHEVAWRAGRDGLFDPKTLVSGKILGIRIPYSENNERRDHRNNPVCYSHLATYVDTFVFEGCPQPWIWHNLWGDILSESLYDFLSRTGSIVLDVLNPKDKSVLERRVS